MTKISVMPKVSVLMPVYNVEKYLNRCLDSLYNQTFKDFEIIAINDGSTDNSPKILEEYTKKDNRIKIITQENQGLSMARNNGLKLAKGEYIYFLDSDDAIHPQCLEIAYTYAKENNADLVCFDYEHSDGINYNYNLIDINKISNEVCFDPLFRGVKKDHINVWSKFYRREFIKDLNFIPNIAFEDFPFVYSVYMKKPKTVYIDAKLYFYTTNMCSISRKQGNPQQIKDYHKGINSIYEIYKAPELKNELSFLRRDLFPNLLKQQLGRCNRADEINKPLMFAEFAKELVDLDGKGLISWRGHKFTRYLTYRKLIKRGKK
ncbi:MAG: glycosyltransferase [Alphaproteobacteria bacterium]|nr:glycosyltransferase [Alphaproteobacteria bacterium]